MKMTKSTSKYVFLFGGMTIYWLSKKYNCAAKSIIKTKYISCSTAVSNVVWIKHFVDDLNLGMLSRLVNVFCENKSVIPPIKSGAYSLKGKHIDLNYHYIQEIPERGEIKLACILSIDMVADPMTKRLPLNKFRRHVAAWD